MPRKLVKMCVDRILPAGERILVAERAIAENPANVPIIPPEPGRENPGPLELALETRTLWQTGRTLRVRFLDGLPQVQAKVQAIAHQWSEHANIKLDFGDHADAEIRISLTPNG